MISSLSEDCLAEDAIRTELAIMCQQETDTYHCDDYLEKLDQLRKPKHERTQSPVSVVFPHLPSWVEIHDQLRVPLSPEDRQALVRFGYFIADCCESNSCPRMTVEIAMSYFDRFMSTREARKWLLFVDEALRGTFVNLIFMTAIYLALKVHGRGSHLPIDTIVQISGSNISIEQVACMEEVFCKALQWRLHPPESGAYVCRLLDLVPSSILSESLKKEIVELSCVQLEVAVQDYALVPISTSTLAYCSLKISLESLVLDDSLGPLDMTPTDVQKVASIWVDALPTLDLSPSTLKHVQDRLCIGIAQNYFHLGAQTDLSKLS